MVVIGLTGGIGMGKSTVADYLADTGECVVDTDVLARELTEPGQPALDEIRTAFGPAVFDAEGTLNRRALASVIFSSQASRSALEEILHPRIRERWKKQIAAWRSGGAQRATVVIPLLYETGAESEVDSVFCVGCSFTTQRFRLRARGWSEEEIASRIQAQMPVTKKIDRADGVIWNETTREICFEQVAQLYKFYCPGLKKPELKKRNRQSNAARTK